MILVKLITSGILLIAFLLFIGGSLRIFDRKEGMPLKLKIISFLILFSMFSLVIILLNSQNTSHSLALIGFIFILLGLIFFIYCYKWIIDQSNKRLTPVTSRDSPTFLFKEGPFTYIRHPFYSAYFTVFLGGAIASNTIFSFLIFGLIFILYLSSAKAEEQKFLGGKLGAEYKDYKNKTGMFLPKIVFDQ